MNSGSRLSAQLTANLKNLGKTEVLTEEQKEALNAMVKENLSKAKDISKEGWEQTKIAGRYLFIRVLYCFVHLD